MQPPAYSKLPGRLKDGKKRLKRDEKLKKQGINPYKLGKSHQQSLKCGKCGQVGHNKRSCKGNSLVEVSNVSICIYMCVCVFQFVLHFVHF